MLIMKRMTARRTSSHGSSFRDKHGSRRARGGRPHYTAIVVEPVVRVTLFVPGKPASASAWNAALQRDGLGIDRGALSGRGLDAPVSAEWVENDGGFGEAFSFGTVAPELLERIDGAPGALVLRWPVDLREGRKPIVAIVERLREAGALAVRLEESKLGWEVSRWLELFSTEDAWAWHRGAVAFLGGEGTLQSCGMHAFSLPDVHVALEGDADALKELASVFNVYQLAEDPLLRSGQTFSPDRDTPRRVVERWPDAQYPPDHACHNPYGVWRLGAAGSTARPIRELVPVFMPTLRVLLAALEEKAGRPLTKEQTEAARDKAPCMAMKPRDVQKLERSRGYADLEPELVWEQWKLVRGAPGEA
jgi:hypothetical protein